MKIKLREEQGEAKSRSCLCQCMEPILCSCYGCMVWLLAKVFLAVFILFLIYFAFLTILQRRDPGEAFHIAIKDLVNMFYPSDPAKRSD